MKTARPLLLAALLVPLTACDELDALGIRSPTTDLARVDLVRAPSVGQAAAWACYTWLGSDTCDFVGFDGRPSRSDMDFSFDLVFDVTNSNVTLPVPMVQVLLGITVLDDTNLGSVCVGFCDPSDPTCTVQSTAAETCDAGADLDLETLGSADTIEGLVDIAADALTGDANLQYRVIDPLSTSEVHVQFDLGVDPVVDILEDVLLDAAMDFFSSDDVRIAVPYTVEGALLFDLTELDRVSVAFGPVAGDFDLAR